MAKQVQVQHLFPVGAVQAFNVGILVRFAFRDILDGQPGRVSPGHEGRAEKLRAVIDTEALRQAALEPQSLQDADQPTA